MFGIGFTELIAIGVIALIFIGPEDLPRMARQLARFLNEMKHSRDDFLTQIQRHHPLESFKKTEDEIKKNLEKPPHES